MKKSSARRTALVYVLIAVAFFTAGTLLGTSVFAGDKDNQKIVDDFGYLERLAYQGAVKYCKDNKYEQAKCDKLMVRTASPFNEEYGAGVHFMFSTARKGSGDTLTISVDILTSERIWSIEKVDDSETNNQLP